MKLFLPELNKLQIDRFSEFVSNLGLVFFASMVVPIFLGPTVDAFMILTGILLSGFCLFISLLLLKSHI